MSIPEWIIPVYVLIGGTLFFVSALVTCLESGKAKRNAARVVLISPAWPVLPLVGLALTVRSLWQAADLSNKR